MSLTKQTLSNALARENAAVTHAPGDAIGALGDAAFNGAATVRPLAVVECADEPAIGACLRVAVDHSVPVSVLVGGHDISGRALGDGNLVLDLRRMSRVEVDVAAGEAVVAGGALTADLLAALPADRVTVTGTVLTVGAVGLTLGGGYGRLNSRFGLAADCLRGARVMLPDGSAIEAGEAADADLLWALRGGGTGFGVVTSMRLAIHALPQVLTAMVLFPLDAAQAALRHAQDLLDEHPVDLSLFMGFVTAPAGEPMLFVAPMWSGAAPAGEAVLRRLVVLRGALVLEQGWRRYKDTFSEEGEKAWPKGRHYHLPTRTFARLDATTVAILVEGARGMTSPNSAIVLHDFHGAASRVAPDATAFPLRDDHFVAEIIAAWDGDPHDDGGRHRGWAERLSADLASVALPGGYVNLLPPGDNERVRRFYGPAAAERLAAIKRRVDPHDRFRSGIGRLSP